ncbi:BrnT family toxin [Solidesulfovibrio sp.]
MQFAWDEAKRQSNLHKHGVDFLDAVAMLGGEPLLLEDDRQDYGERRCLAVGEHAGQLLVVVFTLRGGSFRIISAGRANARERRLYDHTP